jgi:hypothetical protein
MRRRFFYANAKALLLPSTSRWDFVFQFLSIPNRQVVEIAGSADLNVLLSFPSNPFLQEDLIPCLAVHPRNGHFTPKTRMMVWKAWHKP